MKDYLFLKGSGVELAGVPNTISILPLGRVVSSKGTFQVDEESFQSMQKTIARRGIDLVVDYEHQTLKGVEAPAAGWVKELKLENGHIQAVVEWTPRGAEYLKNREYRYLSPVVSVRKTDGKVTELHSLALTNTPAIEHMAPIVNSESYEMEEVQNMDMQKLAELLGLGPEASEEEILEALKTVLAEHKSLKEGRQAERETVVANKAVCELLGLKAGAPTEDVTAKIMELKGGTIDGVNVLAELKALKEQAAQREAEEAVALALKAGKITAAQRDWARSYALDNPAGFASFVEKAPQVVPMGEFDFGGPVALKADALDEATLLICGQLGVNREDLEQYGKER